MVFTLTDVSVLLNYAEGVVFLLLLVHLKRAGLVSRYRFFSAFVFFRLLRLLVLTFVPLPKQVYAVTYFASEPITWLLATLAVLEVYSLVLQNHPGIARMSRRVLVGAMMLAVVVSLSTLPLDLLKTTPNTYLLDMLFMLTRVVMSSLVLFMVLLTMFLFVFPVPLSRNVANHCLLLAAYMGARTLVLLLRNAFGVEVTERLDLLMTSLQLACLIAWCVLLRVNGEDTPARPTRRLSQDEEDRVLQNLDLLNRQLAKSVKGTHYQG